MFEESAETVNGPGETPTTPKQPSLLHGTRSEVQRSQTRGALLAALALTAYLVFFYSFTLPNSIPQTSRLDIWRSLPDILLSCVLPDRDGSPSGWQNFPQRFDLILFAAAILVGAWGTGHLVLRLIRLPLPRKSLERTVLAFGVGLSGISLATLGGGLAGFLWRSLLGGVLIGGFFGEVSLRLWESARRSRKRSPQESPEKSAAIDSTSESPSPVNEAGSLSSPSRRARSSFLAHGSVSFEDVVRGVALLVMGLFLLAMLLGALLPPTDFDVKEYHLQGPKEFFQLGRITFLPHNVYTSFPFLTEMLSLLGMGLRGDWYRGALVGKTVLMCFAPLTALALFAAGRRWFSPSVGWLAAFIYLTTPWTYRISIIAYAEGGLTFYLFATLLAAGLAIERLNDGESPIREVLLAGLLAGSAMACKYTGILQVVIPIGLVLCGAAWWKRPRHSSRWSASLTTAMVFGLGTAITIGPWLAKNTVETGNPVYPLMYSVFGGRDWDSDVNARWHAGHSPKDHVVSDLGVKFIDVTTKSDWLSPLLFGLAPLALFCGRRKRLVRWLWLYVAYLFFTWWVLTHRIDRFWVPLIPVVSLLAGTGAVWQTGRLWRSSLTLILIIAAVFNLGFITTPFCGNNPYLADLAEARDLSETTERGIRFLNQLRLPPKAKVLCVGAAQVFDARFPLVYNTVWDDSFFERWCAAAPDDSDTPEHDLPMRDPDEIRQSLSDAGIALVYVNWSEILRYRPSYGFTDFVTPERFVWLRQHGVLGRPLPMSEGYGDISLLGEESQQELYHWAPSLITQIGGQTVFIAAQVFPVLK